MRYLVALVLLTGSLFAADPWAPGQSIPPNMFLAGPASGVANGKPTGRSMVLLDVPPAVWTGFNGYGLDAARPAAAASNAGYLYFSTDVSGGTLYRSNGVGWDTLVSAGGGGTVTQIDTDDVNIFGGPIDTTGTISLSNNIVVDSVTALTHGTGLLISGKDANVATEDGGSVNITSGVSGGGATGNGGNISITTGTANSTDGSGGSISLTVGASEGTGLGGNIELTAGNGVAANGGNIVLEGGFSFGGIGGGITIDGGFGGTFGTISIGTGTTGNIVLGASGQTNSFVGTWTWPDNVRQTFNPGANAAGINVGAQAGDPGTPVNGDLWYDSVANELTARINGANVVLGGGAAPTTATYITQIPDAGLSNEQALSLLATGLMQVTTTTGVVSSVTTSAGVNTLISDNTGSGALVFGTSPTMSNTTITGNVTGMTTIAGRDGTLTIEAGGTANPTGNDLFVKGGDSGDIDGFGGHLYLRGGSGDDGVGNVLVGTGNTANISIGAVGVPIGIAGPVTFTSTTGITFPDNVRQTFNPGATVAGINVGSHAGDPGTPTNGDLWYDSVANELTARINGANVVLGAGLTGYTTADNTALGVGAGDSISTATGNTAIGVNALTAVTTTGSGFNVAVGLNAADGITSGTANVAIGKDALGHASSSTTSNNVAIGTGAAISMQGSGGNVAIGSGSMATVTTGTGNVAVGTVAMNASFSSQTTAIGAGALGTLISANGNTGLGYNVGATLETGGGNTLLGSSTDTLAVGTTNGIAIGAGAKASSNTFVAGSDGAAAADVYFGEGITNATATDFTLHGTGGSGGNSAGGGLLLAGGISTGTGTSGNIVFRTAPTTQSSGSTPNSLVTRGEWTYDGSLDWTGIATSSAPALSATDHGRIYFDSTTDTFMASQNGGAYAAIGGGIPASLVGGTWATVRVATTDVGTMATSFENGDTIDGIVLVTGDRILIKNQNGTSINGAATDGIYTVNASGAPTRATDLDTTAEFVYGGSVLVREGAVNRGGWFSAASLSSPASFVLGSSTLMWFTEERSNFENAGSWFQPNTHIGFMAGNSLGAKGIRTLIIGNEVANTTTTASNLVAIGQLVMNGSSALGAQSSVAVGQSVFNSGTYSGSFNTGFGLDIGPALTSGTSNIFGGQSVGAGITTGSQNAIWGNTIAGGSSTSQTAALGYNMSIGAFNQTVMIGNNLNNNSGGANNIGIGSQITFGSSFTPAIVLSPTASAPYGSNTMTIAGANGTGIHTLIGGETANSTPLYFRIKTGDASGTDIGGGDMILSPGFGTGTSSSVGTDRSGAVRLQSANINSTGTTLQTTYTDRVIVCRPINLTDNTTTTMATIALPTLATAGGKVKYTVTCTNGTEVQSNNGEFLWNGVNKAGTYTTDSAKTESTVTTSGTLTTTWTITTGTNLINLRLNADSSLSPTVLRISYVVENNSENAVTLP